MLDIDAPIEKPEEYTELEISQDLKPSSTMTTTTTTTTTTKKQNRFLIKKDTYKYFKINVKDEHQNTPGFSVLLKNISGDTSNLLLSF